MQCSEPGIDVWPAGHCVQISTPSILEVLLGQSIHLETSFLQYFPALHLSEQRDIKYVVFFLVLIEKLYVTMAENKVDNYYTPKINIVLKSTTVYTIQYTVYPYICLNAFGRFCNET